MAAPKRKPISRTARGVDAYFSDTEETQDQSTDKSLNKHTDLQVEVQLERATFYVRDDQQPALEELKLNLRRQKGIKTDKSELVRIALDLLTSQDLNVIAERLPKK